MKNIFKNIIFRFADKLVQYSDQYRKESLYRDFDLPNTVKLGHVSLIGNIKIGEHTYINDWSCLSTGDKSKVKIGKHCAIGRHVHISSKTHQLESPTTTENSSKIKHIEADVTIGEGVWIGDKVFITQGVNIGNYAIIGANTFVNREVKPFEIVGGSPMKHIRFNTDHIFYSNS